MSLKFLLPGKKMTQKKIPNAIFPIEDIISDAKNGRMFILVDQEDRENEGDLVIPAEMANAEMINFMATHGRGLICLAMTSDKIQQLNLPLMANANSSRHETAFTISIEAREGVTTGISAYDRATTIKTAINPHAKPQDIASPGHVFPLQAKNGGVLVRAGHTEAAVDISRLAGLNASGVICEIMNDDGTMARLPDLLKFSEKHNLKVGTISDLIAYRRQNDNLVRQVSTKEIFTVHGGSWVLKTFEDQISKAEHLVLIKGEPKSTEPTLVRMHSLNLFEDVLGTNEARYSLIPNVMKQIAINGTGVIVLLNKMDKEYGIDGSGNQILRQYGIGAQILIELGIAKIKLLSNSPTPKVIGLDGYKLEIESCSPIMGDSDA